MLTLLRGKKLTVIYSNSAYDHCCHTHAKFVHMHTTAGTNNNKICHLYSSRRYDRLSTLKTKSRCAVHEVTEIWPTMRMKYKRQRSKTQVTEMTVLSKFKRIAVKWQIFKHCKDNFAIKFYTQTRIYVFETSLL